MKKSLFTIAAIFALLSILNAQQTGTFTDERDGRVYKWVKIGEQVWMAENLAFLPEVFPGTTGYVEEKNYYVYGYDGNSVSEAKKTKNYMVFGALYNWKAAMDGAASSTLNPSEVQGACPSGWHLPSYPEWMELAGFIDKEKGPFEKGSFGWDKIGAYILDTLALERSADSKKMTKFPEEINFYRFSVLPGGARNLIGGYISINKTGFFQCSTEKEGNDRQAMAFLVNASMMTLSDYEFGKNYGFSVRCVKNK